jgi:hypothetical protein
METEQAFLLLLVDNFRKLSGVVKVTVEIGVIFISLELETPPSSSGGSSKLSWQLRVRRPEIVTRGEEEAANSNKFNRRVSAR